MIQSKTKQCQNCKVKFIIEPEDFKFYKKMDVPEPTFCPECRIIRRFAFQNERTLYKRKCDFSGDMIFSQFSQDAPVKVYEKNIWWSDKWDSMDYGKDYNFNKPFFEQFKELRKEVPWTSRAFQDLVNSDYCMNVQNLKNCYLVFASQDNEDCAYGDEMSFSKDCYDNSSIAKCELCYDGFQNAGCYKTLFSSFCTDSQEVYFSKNLINCQNCFGCTNLRHKKYHIFNKPYTKKEYEKKLEKFNLGSYKSVVNLKQKEEHDKYPVKFMDGRKNVNVTGNDIYNSKNIIDSFGIGKCEDSKYCQGIHLTQDSYDYSGWGENARIIYEVSRSGNNLNGLKFCHYCVNGCRDLEYCIECHDSTNCFGCAGLDHKQYCILNKQYTKEEYNELVPKIKQHMNEMLYIDKKGRMYKYGEFFPVELSPFAYNETIANEDFSLSKKDALEQGYAWYDKPKPEYKATIKAKDLSDNIKDVDNSILKEVIECSNANNDCAGSTVFRIIPTELKFYQKQNIPLPRLCSDCRYRERIKQRNPMKLYYRQCMKKGCSVKFQTTYAPNRKEIVYCEKCYNKEVG